jgi:hypothetical protein
VVLLLPLWSALVMWWAVHYQRRVLELITANRPVADRVADRELVQAGGPAARSGAAPPGAVPSGAWAAAWTDSCTVTVALAMAGTALIAARHCDDGDEFTLVVLIGSDGRAGALMSLLDRWVREGVAVRLHPAAAPGTIELLDERGNTIRAVLLAA